MSDTALAYRRVTARYIATVQDSTDDGPDPDVLPLQGQVTFVPQFQGSSIVYSGLKLHVRPEPIVARIIDGDLLVEVAAPLVEGEGEAPVVLQPLSLLVTEDPRANQTWTWRAEFDSITRGDRDITLTPHAFVLPEGQAPLDLAETAGVATGTTIHTVGPPGPGLASITEADGVLTFTWDDGRKVLVPVPEAVQGVGVNGVAVEDGALVLSLTNGNTVTTQADTLLTPDDLEAVRAESRAAAEEVVDPVVGPVNAATPAATPGTIVERDENARAAFKSLDLADAPVNASDAVRKDYADQHPHTFADPLPTSFATYPQTPGRYYVPASASPYPAGLPTFAGFTAPAWLVTVEAVNGGAHRRITAELLSGGPDVLRGLKWTCTTILYNSTNIAWGPWKCEGGTGARQSSGAAPFGANYTGTLGVQRVGPTAHLDAKLTVAAAANVSTTATGKEIATLEGEHLWPATDRVLVGRSGLNQFTIRVTAAGKIMQESFGPGTPGANTILEFSGAYPVKQY